MGLLSPAAPAREIDKYTRMMLCYSKRIEYRRITAYEDFEEMGRLRALSYNSNDTLSGHTDSVILDTIDFEPSSFCYGIYLDGDLVSTLRIQHISKAFTDGPAVEYFGDVVQPLMDQGMRFIVPGRFAMDPAIENKSMTLPLMALRLSGLAMRHFEANAILSLIRKGHAAYHRRFLGATQISPLRQFGDVREPLMLFHTPRARENDVFRRYPFFDGLPHEEKLLFGLLQAGKPAPLTILPTACEALGIYGDPLQDVA